MRRPIMIMAAGLVLVASSAAIGATIHKAPTLTKRQAENASDGFAAAAARKLPASDNVEGYTTQWCGRYDRTIYVCQINVESVPNDPEDCAEIVEVYTVAGWRRPVVLGERRTITCVDESDGAVAGTNSPPADLKPYVVKQ